MAGLLVAPAIVGAALVHHWIGLRMPVPWSDESYFLLSARALLTRSSLRVPELGQPDGIFWMTDGYPMIVAAWWRVTGTMSLEAARWASFTATAVAAGFFAAAATKRLPGVAAGLLIAAWLLAPHTVFVGNFARMEAFVLLAIAIAALAVSTERYLGALGVLISASVIHPAALFFLAAVVLTAGRRSVERPRRWELWLAATGLALAVLQLGWWAANVDAVVDHVGAQLDTKASLRLRASAGAAPLLVALASTAALVVRRPAIDQPGRTLAGLAAAGGLVTALGRDLAYDGYGYETGALLLLLAFTPARRARLPVGALVAAYVVAMHLALPYGSQLLDGRDQAISHYRLYGMSPADGPRNEWSRFIEDVVDELAAIPAEEQVTIVVPAGAPGGFDLVQGAPAGVTVIQATKLARHEGDFAAVMLARYLTGGVPPPAPPPGVSHAVRSSDGNFMFWIEPA